RRWPVALEEIVADPGKRIRLDDRHPHQPPGAGNRRREQPDQYQAGADEVQPPRRAVGVLAQVIRIELAERAKRRLLFHCTILQPAPPPTDGWNDEAVRQPLQPPQQIDGTRVIASSSTG